MTQPRKRQLEFLGLVLPMALLAGGCKKEAAITTYTAPKEIASPQNVAEDSPPPHEPAESTAQGETGFPADLRWTLPAGWKQVAPPQNPFFKPVAAIQVAADQPTLLLTVSQLPDSPGARSIMENVARWARQLKIDPPAESDLGKYVAHLQVAGVPMDVVTLGGATAADNKLLGAILPHGQDTWVFKLSGPASAVDAQSGPFADFLHSIRFENASPAPLAGPSAPSPAPAPGGDNQAAGGLGGAKWTLPAGWTVEPGATGSLRLATIRPGNAPAEIKVSKLGMVGGGLGMNVSRWHGEVGLPPVDDEHADPGQKVQFGGQAWVFHDYTGPANGGMREIIAMAEAAGSTWYFKLVGPTEVVGKAKADFEQFISTVKLQ